ncbi:murein hydrolase activator EnvC family protein [Croceicoccus bisphenolivorans]|uniref:murein hydrolase activator EnvC family protein n=1 Tax=Croceicoccus bisphenolivorans TaxID=1783232 RepID=UPI00082B7C4D|nr:peptidoglycan DD-metalloendopeptidase family protein [Croceicoccus bisphenolivorans]
MRWQPLVLLIALLPAAAGAATNADRLREVEAARALAEKQAAQFADQARLIQDSALKAEARANRLTAEIAEAESRLEAAQIRAETAGTRLALLRDDLAISRKPLSRMMAALQRLARRPTLLLVMRPSSIRDFVRMRAMVAGLQPQIATRTADLRKDLSEARTLADETETARADGERARSDLAERRERLAELGAKNRLTASDLVQQASAARREATLRGAQAASIGKLVADERAGERTLAALAALPAPSLLAGTGKAQTVSGDTPKVPVRGRLLAGFGERDAAGGRSKGMTIVPAPGAAITAPLAGEVAFAGPFRGYGTLVILRHAGDRTSLLAGLAAATVKVGSKVRRGETVGTAPDANPAILYELRQGQRAVHPLKP